MKKLLTILFCGFALISFGQKGKNKSLGFDIVDFNKKMEVVEWLYEYDVIAWVTSDSVLVQDQVEIDRLGEEWFCFQEENKTWHAVYGNYKDGIFDLVFHFRVDTTGRIERTFDSIDTLLLNTYARALITANSQYPTIRSDSGLRFNQFIRQNPDKTFSVWIFPAFQPNSTAVYGGEFVFTVDQTGNEIIADESNFQGDFRSFPVDKSKEIWLDYTDLEKSTIGSIFFAWYYKEFFAKIIIDNSKTLCTVMELDGVWTWVHAIKDQRKKKTKNK